jgi:hypothetical protein
MSQDTRYHINQPLSRSLGDNLLDLGYFNPRRFNLRRLNHDLSVNSGFPLPPSLQQFTEFESWQWMSLCVNDHLIERQQIIWREKEIEVLQGFGLRLSEIV